MNILLVCRSYYPHIGGIETSIYQLSKAFAKQGYNVTIITTSEKTTNKREEYGKIVYVESPNKLFGIIPPLYLFLLSHRINNIYHELKKENYSLVIGRDTFMTHLAIKEFHKSKIVYIPSMDVKAFVKTIHRNVKNFKDLILKSAEIWQYKIEIHNQQTVLKNADLNIVFCNNMKKQLYNSYSGDYSCQICYPGCTFEKEYISKQDFKQVLNLLFVGRISPEKNLDMLFEALMLINFKVKLVIVGDGFELERLKEMSKLLPSNIQVKFEGKQLKTKAYYIDADYLVFPSKYESFGQVIIEAFTCGTPVIGFRSIPNKTITAIDELVIDGETGIICKQFDAASLAEAINLAYQHCQNREKKIYMSKACQSFATLYCSWEKLADSCLKALQNI